MRLTNILTALLILLLLTTIAVAAIRLGRSEEETLVVDPAVSVHDFIVQDIDGKDVKLDQYKGQVLLLVNVASKCGYTYQYEGLQNLYARYRDRGLMILGFPANNFARQEPGSNAEIKAFCSTEFGVDFPMFSKLSVKGHDQHPLYAFLTDKNLHPETGGKITWNFNKFLVDRDGQVVARFNTKVEPESDELLTVLETLLNP